jgi:hypothetical protein
LFVFDLIPPEWTSSLPVPMIGDAVNAKQVQSMKQGSSDFQKKFSTG